MDQSTVPDLQLTYSSILNPAVKALEFIGQTSVVRDIEDEFPKEGLTVSFWVKTTDSQGDVMLFSYGARTGDNSRRLWLKNPSDIEVGFGSSGTGLTGVAINDGQWHNLAFTLKPSDNKHYGIQIFKDGVPAFRATGAISHPADKRLEPFGKLELGLGIENEKGLRGLLSEFCFWNRLLTEDEIITFMQVRREGSKEGLILYWALDSQASCGELTNGQFIESDLTFRSVTMFAVWSEISGAVYDLVVKNAEGRVVYEKKGITGLKETIENYYVNKQYVASVRAVLDGVPGEWSQPFVLRVLNLQKVNAAMEEDQAQNIWVEWQAVDQAQSYLVEKYENGGTQPEVITQTDKKSDLTALVRGNDWWQFDTKAFSEGSIGPPSDIIASGQTDVDFCYINDDEDIPFFHVSWNRPLPLPEFFCVQIFSMDNSDVPIYEYICDNTVVSWRIDNPNVAESKKYKARIRGISQGIIGTWSVWKELSVYDLAVPRTRFAYSLEDKLLKLLWEDIRTSQQKEAGLVVSYKIDFYRDQEAVPYIEDYTTELCYAISQDRVLDDCEYRIKVSAWADGSQGGASSADEIDVPVITGFRFDFNDGKMYAEWSGIGNGRQGYVTVQKDGATNLDYTEYVSGSESGKGSTAYTVSGAVDEDLYTAKIRAMDSGYITKYSQDNPTVTINKMVNPVITSSPCNTSEKSITAVWSFDDASLQGVSYNLELWDNELQRILLTSGPVTAKAYTFKDTSLISPGNIYNLRVQAQAGGSYGKWSSYMLVPCIGGIVIKSDPQANISVSWSRINAAEAYKVSIYIDGVFKKTCVHTQQTLVTFSKSDTGLANGNTYKVKVDISVIKSGQTSQPAYEQIDRLKIEPSDNPHDGGDDGSHKEGDPVDTATGAYLYSHEDLGINCVEPLRFIVYYGTDVPTPQENNVYDGKPLGYRWNHAYNTKIVSLEDGKELGIIWGNGDVYKYGAPASNNSECQPVFAPRGYTLAVDEAGIYTLTKKDRYKYRFSKDGMLLSISSPCGNTVTLSYSGIRLDRIQFNENIYLEIGYNDKGLIEWVRDNGGRRVVYAYQGFNLTTITNTMDKYRTFEYDDNSHIKSITDENGHTFIKNVYDNEGRVTFQQDARAVAEGKSYGNAFSYAVAVEDNLEMIVTDFTDRSGNIAKFKSYKTSKCMKCAVYQLGEDIIRRIDRTYDGFNNILSETVYEGSESQYRDGMGNTTSFTYDQYNNLVTETDPLGQSKYYSYDNNNNMQSETDKLGNTRYFYYEKGLMTKITDFLGRDTVITYDDGTIKGLVKMVKDALGNVFSFKYSGIWLSEMESPLGDITRFTNDSFGRPALEEISGADGVVLKTTYMEYDHAGNITQKRVVFPDQTPQDGYTHTFYFDNIGNNTGYTDPENNIITYRYDSNDFLKEIIYPANNGVNRKTVYEYDPSDNLIKAGYSPAVVEKFQYDRFQRILKYTDANSNVYQVDYSQVISEKEQDGSTYFQKSTLKYPGLDSSPETTFSDVETYDALGRVTAFQDKTGEILRIAYNKVLGGTEGMNEEVCYSLPPAKDGETSNTIRRGFDPLGRLIWIINEAGKTSSISYTAESNRDTNTYQEVITFADPLGNKKIVTVDALGRTVGYKEGKDEVLKEYVFRYDALGRLISSGEKLESGFVYTQYSYCFDPETKHIVVSVGKPGDNSSPSYLEYNGLLQLIKETRQDGNFIEKTYTPWGGLKSFTNGRKQRVDFEYDEAGRFYKIKLPGTSGEITHVLDGNGNRTETRMGENIIRRNFDNWNRLKSRQDSNNKTIGYDYTPLDLVKTLIYSDNKQVGYDYDNLCRLVKVTDWNNRNTSYDYDVAGNLIKINYPNGSFSAMSFDDAGRLSGIAHKKDDILISKIDYELDASGNRKAAHTIYPLPPLIPKDTRNFTYNTSNQVTSLNGQNLGYDEDGNLLGFMLEEELKEIRYDEFNRVMGFGNDLYSYDADGLRVSSTVKGISKSFVHDINNYKSPMLEMATASVAAGEAAVGSRTPEYGYECTPFDSIDRILEAYDVDEKIECRYVYGLGLISREDKDGVYQAYHFDGNGSTLALTDITGTVTDRYAYDVYGAVYGEANTANPFLYTGRYGVYDDGNGIAYMRARTYAPCLLRFLQEDFLKGSPYNPQSLNRYAYVRGNPVLMIDPLGLSGGKDSVTKEIITLLFGVVAGGVIGAIIAAAVTGGTGGAAGGAAVGTVGGAVGGSMGGTVGVSTGSVRGTRSSSRFLRYRGYSRRDSSEDYILFEVELQHLKID